MAAFLGLLVALAYGCGDFFGGLAASRSKASAVVVGSFSVSAALLVAVTLGWGAIGGRPPATRHDLALGVASGLVAPVALGCLYRGLAAGRMSVVAPTTAVVAAIVPFVWGVTHGERPSQIAVAGAVISLVAVGLISGAPAHPEAPPPSTADAPLGSGGLIGLAVASGLGFGAIFVLFGSTSDQAGVWPLLGARFVALTVTVSTLGGWALARGRASDAVPMLVPVRATWPAVAAAGVLDITANVLYLSATRLGLLSIVAVLSSLYPASTVLLARVVLDERLHRLQIVGLALAAGGVMALATG